MAVEPVEVTARFNEQGQIEPLSFMRRGRIYPIDRVGRRWEDESGKHFMVMTPIERVFELIFEPGSLRWFFTRVGKDRLTG